MCAGRIAIAAGLIVLLALPAGAVAKPTKQDRRIAAKECKMLRGTTDESREAFKAQYRNLGACVSEKAREEAPQRRAAKRTASGDCRDERKQRRGRLRRAVPQLRQVRVVEGQEGAREPRTPRTAARSPRRRTPPRNAAPSGDSIGEEPFAEKYGTNHNKKNAFGKCVSGKSGDEPNDDEDNPPVS